MTVERPDMVESPVREGLLLSGYCCLRGRRLPTLRMGVLMRSGDSYLKGTACATSRDWGTWGYAAVGMRLFVCRGRARLVLWRNPLHK